MNDLLSRIEQRAAAMPWMTAVRLSGEVVTYGDLYQRICEYDRVVSRHALSENAALSAALMSFLPDAIRRLEPEVQGRWVADAIMWLGRGLAEDDTLSATG
ncbi:MULTISPECIES: hypothetical protein [unclassified Gordonia (in: high G+C Gram-positive bacteria)]|uniref:hypothetical protein n=1 Tax=unclassified Gordonia (in: high G+C Gram-positive bacteria) TaxID=2657482 RepID=UPI001FFF5F1A|nr:MULTISPECIES: hypothetical protein [unclassified Gordonia (in: high G+C Gram-positive bacteria)]UQE74417.1 hypothetical protein MYK68_17100 [Gordonia sp. PP30]